MLNSLKTRSWVFRILESNQELEFSALNRIRGNWESLIFTRKMDSWLLRSQMSIRKVSIFVSMRILSPLNDTFTFSFRFCQWFMLPGNIRITSRKFVRK